MKHKLHKKIFLILLVCFLFSLTFVSSFSGSGTGTLGDPFQITNCTQLQEMSNSLSSNYIQMNNIECNDTKNWNGGLGFNPIGDASPTWNAFTGVFNGQNYNITNLNIYRMSLDNSGIGLFGYSSGIIKNVNLFYPNISSNGTHIGSLVGYLYKGNVSNCSSQLGNIFASNTSYYSVIVGGLVGTIRAATNEYASIIDSFSSNNVTGVTYIGGLVGYLDAYNNGKSLIDRCYSIGNIFGLKYSLYNEPVLSGLVGRNWKGYINNSYSLSNLTILSKSGGYLSGLVTECYQCFIDNSYFAGNISYSIPPFSYDRNGIVSYWNSSNGGNITNTFWDINVSGTNTSQGGIGKNTTQMKDIITYLNVGWNIVNYTSNQTIWGINMSINLGYPFLQKYISLISEVILNKPDNLSSKTINVEFNCTGFSYTNLSTSTLQIWNKTSNLLYYNLTQNVSGLLNTTIFYYNFTESENYLWNCMFFNGNEFFTSTNNYTLYINLISPAITLENPLNNQYINNKNTSFQFISIDNDSLSSCELWSNFTGIWNKNYTWLSPISGTTTSTNINLEDNYYYWNIWCNDTLNNGGFSPNNFSFTLDTIYPETIINNIATTQGSQTITFYSNSFDNNSYSCKYSIYNLAGGIDGINENISFSCNNPTTATVSGFATYILKVYTIDIAGNENWTNQSFITFTTTPPAGGGGGGTPVITTGNWTMETEFGGSSYQFTMIQASSRNKDLVFENFGTTSRTIKLTCEPVSGVKNLCDTIEFQQSTFALPLQRDIKTSIGFSVVIPDNYEKDNYVVNLIGTDEVGNKGIITLNVEVTSYSSITGAITKLFSNTESDIPYFLIFALISFVSGVLINFTLFKPNKIPAALSVVAGLFFGVIFLLLPI